MMGISNIEQSYKESKTFLWHTSYNISKVLGIFLVYLTGKKFFTSLQLFSFFFIHVWADSTLHTYSFNYMYITSPSVFLHHSYFYANLKTVFKNSIKRWHFKSFSGSELVVLSTEMYEGKMLSFLTSASPCCFFL